MNEYAKITPRMTDILEGRASGVTAPPPQIDLSALSANSAPESDKPTEQVSVKPLKIALIGTAPSSRDLAPFNDPSWTIWACSPGNMGILPRVDAWFEIHSNLLFPECRSYGEPYIAWLKQQKFPIYMQDQRLVPNATPYPLDIMVAKYGKYFFTSSFAYMMAMAIEFGAAEIGLFGIDMASKDEYILQRPGGHFFMQTAAMRGIKVLIPNESDLGQHPALYGYSDSTPFGRKVLMRKQELKGRIEGMKAERDKLSHGITYLEGALEDVDYFEGIWSGVQT